MRAISLALLAVAVIALTVAGLGTAARLGVFQAGTPPAGESGLDPQSLSGSGAASPLPSGVCPPLPESSPGGGSSLQLGGPCPVAQTGRAYCRAAEDDFYVLLRRALPGGRTLDLYLDVEYYHGPGSYDGAQTLLLVQDGSALYTWSNFRTRATVLPDERGVRFASTTLVPEAGRSGRGEETVTGTLACGAPAPR